HQRRKTHQNRFRSAARFESKDRPTIVEKIEFDVAASTIQLILTLAFTVRLIHSSSCDWKVCVQKSVPHIVNEGEVLFTLSLQVIEENAPDAAHLAAMLECEIFIAPLLESWIELGVVAIASLLDGSMKVPSVFVDRVIGSEIHSTAKPLCI